MTKYFYVDHHNNSFDIIPADYDTFKKAVLDHENHISRLGYTVFVYSRYENRTKTLLGFEIKG